MPTETKSRQLTTTNTSDSAPKTAFEVARARALAEGKVVEVQPSAAFVAAKKRDNKIESDARKLALSQLNGVDVSDYRQKASKSQYDVKVETLSQSLADAQNDQKYYAVQGADVINMGDRSRPRQPIVHPDDVQGDAFVDSLGLDTPYQPGIRNQMLSLHGKTPDELDQDAARLRGELNTLEDPMTVDEEARRDVLADPYANKVVARFDEKYASVPNVNDVVIEAITKPDDMGETPAIREKMLRNTYKKNKELFDALGVTADDLVVFGSLIDKGMSDDDRVAMRRADWIVSKGKAEAGDFNDLTPEQKDLTIQWMSYFVKPYNRSTVYQEGLAGAKEGAELLGWRTGASFGRGVQNAKLTVQGQLAKVAGALSKDVVAKVANEEQLKSVEFAQDANSIIDVLDPTKNQNPGTLAFIENHSIQVAARMLPDMAASVGVSALTGTPVAGYMYWVQNIQWSRARELRADGVDPGVAEWAALLEAIPSAAVEQMQIKGLDPRTAQKALRSWALMTAKEYGGELTEEIIQAGMTVFINALFVDDLDLRAEAMEQVMQLGDAAGGLLVLMGPRMASSAIKSFDTKQPPMNAKGVEIVPTSAGYEVGDEVVSPDGPPLIEDAPPDVLQTPPQASPADAGATISEESTDGSPESKKGSEGQETAPLEFADTTDIPLYDNILKNPEYHAREKGTTSEVVQMTPDEYIDAAVSQFWEDSGRENAGKEGYPATIEELRAATVKQRGDSGVIDDYIARWKAGEKPPMPVLEYTERGGNQEGLHRAIMAKQAGLKTMPVLKVYNRVSAEDAASKYESSPVEGQEQSRTSPLGQSLESRGVVGDALLDATDLADELSSVGGDVSDDGMVTLYHRTSADNAAKIVENQSMIGREDRLFFGTHATGEIDGYGDTVVKVRLPLEKLELNDVFGDREAHVTLKSGRPGTSIKMLGAEVVPQVAPTTPVDGQEQAETERKQPWEMTRDEWDNTFKTRFQLGRHVLFALPREATVLKPSKSELQIAATALGISAAEAQRALTEYNYGPNDDAKPYSPNVIRRQQIQRAIERGDIDSHPDYPELTKAKDAPAELKTSDSAPSELKAETERKQPWEMTKAEWVNEQGELVSGQSVGKTKSLARLLHKDHVRIWLSEGKPVSPEALAGYPDLSQATQEEAAPKKKPAVDAPRKLATDEEYQAARARVMAEPDGHFKGDAYKFTGKTITEAGREWREAEMLEGPRKGEKIPIKSVADTEKDLAEKAEQRDQEQAAFRRLREAEESIKADEAKVQAILDNPPTDAASFIALIESHTKDNGALERGGDFYTMLAKNLTDAELQKVVEWSRNAARSSSMHRFFGGNMEAELRLRERAKSEKDGNTLKQEVVEPKTVGDLDRLTFDTISDYTETEGVARNKGTRYRSAKYIATDVDGVERTYTVRIDSKNNVKITDGKKTKKQLDRELQAEYDALSPATKSAMSALDLPFDNITQRLVVGRVVDGRRDKATQNSFRVVITNPATLSRFQELFPGINDVDGAMAALREYAKEYAKPEAEPTKPAEKKVEATQESDTDTAQENTDDTEETTQTDDTPVPATAEGTADDVPEYERTGDEVVLIGRDGYRYQIWENDSLESAVTSQMYLDEKRIKRFLSEEFEDEIESGTPIPLSRFDAAIERFNANRREAIAKEDAERREKLIPLPTGDDAVRVWIDPEAKPKNVKSALDKIKPDKKIGQPYKPTKTKALKPTGVPVAKTQEAKLTHLGKLTAAVRYGEPSEITPFIHKSDGWASSTDGSSLWRLKDDTLADGVYEPGLSENKTVDGTRAQKSFRDVLKLVEKNYGTIENVDPRELRTMIRKAAAVAGGDEPMVGLFVNADSGTIGVGASSVEIGTAEINIGSGAELFAGVSPKRILADLEFLIRAGETSITVKHAVGSNPIGLFGKSAEAVLMPINVESKDESVLKKLALGLPAEQTHYIHNGLTVSASEYKKIKEGTHRVVNNQVREIPADDRATDTPVAPTPTAESEAPAQEGTATAESLDDFGEKLGGARKDLPAFYTSEFSDEDIESKPLSKIWPKSEIDNIEDVNMAAFAFMLRDRIPSKPRKSYKLKQWVEQVRSARDSMKVLMEIGWAALREQIIGAKSRLLTKGLAQVDLLVQVDRSEWGRIGEVAVFDDGKGWAYVDGRRVFSDVADGLAEAVKARLAEAKPSTQMKFQVRRLKDGRVFINRKGDALYRTLMEFDKPSEAFDFIKNNSDDLIAEWEKIKDEENVKETDVRRAVNRGRGGEDYRNGVDATPEMFLDTFGFRGVEFGKWVTQGKNAKERQGMVNAAYDALMDLAGIIGISPKAVSLNGVLGLGFGSRGHGWASAHFEPDSLVINLTKTRGAGALAHEWFHALDAYFGGDKFVPTPGKGHKHIMEAGTGTVGRPDVVNAFHTLREVLRKSPLTQRSKRIDKGQSGGYWGRSIEVAARAFESHIIQKMADAGYNNDYLSNVVDIDEWGRKPDVYPYPLAEELGTISPAFDAVFEAIEEEPSTSPSGKPSVRLYSNPMFDPELIAESVTAALKAGKWAAEHTTLAARWLLSRAASSSQSLRAATSALVKRFGVAIKAYASTIYNRMAAIVRSLKDFRAVSESAYQHAKERLSSGVTLYAGLPVQQLADFTIIGLHHFESLIRNAGIGAAKFTAWSKEMVEDIGPKVKPFLNTIWKRSKTQRMAIIRTEKSVTKAQRAARKDVVKQIKATTEVPAGESITMTAQQLLKYAMKKAQVHSVKAYLAGAKDVVKTHGELIAYAEQNVPDEYRYRVMGSIGRARTPSQITAAVASIDMLADSVLHKESRDMLRASVKRAIEYIASEPFGIPADKKTRVREILDTLYKVTTPASTAVGLLQELNQIVAHEGVETDPIIEMAGEAILAEVVKNPAVSVQQLDRRVIGLLSNAIDYLAHTIRMKNNLFLGERNQTFEAVKNDVVNAIVSRGEQIAENDRSREPKIRHQATRDLLSFETKINGLAGLEGTVKKVLIDNLRQGEAETQRIVQWGLDTVIEAMDAAGMDIDKMSDRKRSRRKRRKIADTVALPSAVDHHGNRVDEVHVTPAERMAIWLNLNDPSTRESLLQAGSMGIEFSSHKGRAIKLYESDMLAIQNSITDGELKVAQAISDVINSDMVQGELNRAWVRDRGYEKFHRPNYYPRRRSHSFEDVEPSKVFRTWTRRELDNQPFAKSREGSSKPIAIGDAFEEFYSYLSGAAAYIGKHAAAMDAVRVLGSVDVKEAIRSRVKDSDYLISDLNKTLAYYRGLDEVPQDIFDKGYDKLLKRFTIGALGAKVKVILFQPLSYLAANTEIKLEYLIKALAPMGNKKADAEIREFSPIQWLRRQGSGHAVLSAGISDLNLRRAFGKKDGLVSRGAMGGIRAFDWKTIRRLWRAVKMEVRDAHPELTGDDYMREVARRVDEVVARTQPSSDALSVSSYSRDASKSGVKKALTMYSNQRSKNLNMATRAAQDLMAEPKTPANVAKNLRNILIPTVVNAAMVSAITSAYWAVVRPDDDDDKDGMDRAIDILSVMLGNIQVLGSPTADAVEFMYKNLVNEDYPTYSYGTILMELKEDVGNTMDHLIKAIKAGDSEYQSGAEKGLKVAPRELAKAIRSSLMPLAVSTGLPLPGIGQITEGVKANIDRRPDYAHPDYLSNRLFAAISESRKDTDPVKAEANHTAARERLATYGIDTRDEAIAVLKYHYLQEPYTNPRGVKFPAKPGGKVSRSSYNKAVKRLDTIWGVE